MARQLITALRESLLKLDESITNAILRKFQPGLCIAGFEIEKQEKKFSIKDIWDNGFLWGVPKHRRPIEKRWSRKFGWPKYNWKPLVPKTNLIMCRKCGHHHEAYTICGHCWKKVKAETKEIQDAIQKELKLDPIKDDIVVLYEGEQDTKSEDFWKDQRIVEIPKKRPSWFHQNLLESTTQPLSDSKEIKPKNLA